MGKDLRENYRTGEISKIAGNYSQYKGVSDYIDKQMEAYNKDGKGISADRAKAYKQHFLKNFAGTQYDASTGQYNMMQAFNPMANIDIRKSFPTCLIGSICALQLAGSFLMASVISSICLL